MRLRVYRKWVIIKMISIFTVIILWILIFAFIRGINIFYTTKDPVVLISLILEYIGMVFLLYLKSCIWQYMNNMLIYSWQSSFWCYTPLIHSLMVEQYSHRNKDKGSIPFEWAWQVFQLLAAMLYSSTIQFQRAIHLA